MRRIEETTCPTCGSMGTMPEWNPATQELWRSCICGFKWKAKVRSSPASPPETSSPIPPLPSLTKSPSSQPDAAVVAQNPDATQRWVEVRNLLREDVETTQRAVARWRITVMVLGLGFGAAIFFSMWVQALVVMIPLGWALWQTRAAEKGRVQAHDNLRVHVEFGP